VDVFFRVHNCRCRWTLTPLRSPRVVSPRLEGLCFNCLWEGHINATCYFPARCCRCRREGHSVASCSFPACPAPRCWGLSVDVPPGVGGEAHEPSPHASSTMLNIFQIQWHIILLDFGRSEAKAPAKPKARPERGGGLPLWYDTYTLVRVSTQRFDSFS
jgi:hypothetical protein